MTAPALATSDDRPMPTEIPAALAAVRRAGRRFARTQRARDAAKAALDEAIRAADRAGGITRAQIIAASGMSRRTVYLALGEADSAAAEEPNPGEDTPT